MVAATGLPVLMGSAAPQLPNVVFNLAIWALRCWASWSSSTFIANSPGSALNAFSLQAWAAWYAFYNVAKAVQGDITAESLDAALKIASDVSTEGMTPNVDFTKAQPYGDVTREFNTSVVMLKAENGKAVQVGGFIDPRTAAPGILKN